MARLHMDLTERISQSLSQAIDIEQIKLEDDDGVIGYVVSSNFNGMEFVDRQMKIQRALRGGAAPLSRAELRRIGAIAALTPDEISGVECLTERVGAGSRTFRANRAVRD